VDPRAGRFPLFDSLRGMAAIMVLAVHSSGVAGALSDDAAARPYQGRLEVAFAIFFVVSAFLLYRPFVRANLRGEPALDARAYAWRRFLRIVPAYFVALTVLALVYDLPGVFSLKGIFTYYGFLQIYSLDTVSGGIAQAWTLGVEVVFYASLPLWALAMRRLGDRHPDRRLQIELGGVALLVLGSLAYNAILTYGGFVDRITYSPVPVLAIMPGYLDHLGLGMALAVASVWLEDRPRQPWPVRVIDRHPAVPWLVAAVGFWVASTQIGLTGLFGQLYTPTQYMERHLLNSLISVCLVLPAVFGEQKHGLVRRFLGNRALLYVGLISYGFYLYHYLWVIQLAKWDFGSVTIVHPYLTWLIGGTAGAVVLGSLSYYLIERPALSLKRLVPPRRPDRMPDEATAEPAPLAPAGP
jgi:peptidoglycan/LPS O-acetylase OafA/YrhL